MMATTTLPSHHLDKVVAENQVQLLMKRHGNRHISEKGSKARHHSPDLNNWTRLVVQRPSLRSTVIITRDMAGSQNVS